MWAKCVFICALIAFVRAQTGTEVSRCLNNPGDLPIFTEVVGCVNPPCQLPQLEDVVLNIVFQAPKTMRSMTTLATAYYIPLIPIIGEVPIPYDLGENAVTCNFLTNSYCPVLQGEVLQYQLRMFIESFFPVNTRVTLEFRIVDTADRTPVACIRVPIQIVEARPQVDRSSS